MAKPQQLYCQAFDTAVPLAKDTQGPAAHNFFTSPELVACVLESGVFTSDDLYQNLRINKFFNIAIRGNPKLQRIMKLRSVADNKIPTTHEEKHNMITAHLADFFLNAERFEIRPFELMSEFTRLEDGGEVFSLSFERNAIEKEKIRHAFPLGPMSSKKFARSFDDHGKRIFQANDRAKQSWEDMLLTPFPVNLEINLKTTFEIEIIGKYERCGKTHIRKRQRFISWKVLKYHASTVGEVARLLEHQLGVRKTFERQER